MYLDSIKVIIISIFYIDSISSLAQSLTECYIMKSESEKAEDEFSLDINKQLTWVMLQRDKLQKKQKWITIQSKIEILQVIKMKKKNHQAFTWIFIKNLSDLHIIFIMSTMTKWNYHEVILQK